MALAENHRNALKAEAASVLKASNPGENSSINHEAAESAGNPHASTGDPYHPHHHHQRSRHQYSDMLNQVYTSHLTAQLQQHQHHDGSSGYAFPMDPTATTKAAAESLAEALVDKDAASITAVASFQAFGQSQQQQHLDYNGYGGPEMLGAYGGAQQISQRYHSANSSVGSGGVAATSQYLSYYRHQLSAVVHCGPPPPAIVSPPIMGASGGEENSLGVSSGGVGAEMDGKTTAALASGATADKIATEGKPDCALVNQMSI